MTKAAEKLRSQKFAALRARIAVGGNLDPATLSQSYGLPQPEVEKMLRNRHA